MKFQWDTIVTVYHLFVMLPWASAFFTVFLHQPLKKKKKKKKKKTFKKRIFAVNIYTINTIYA